VQALNLRVERFDADSVTLRLPQSDQLSRAGGMLCGQAMMAAADTAMVLALINHFGQFRPCSTVQLSSSFMKPLSGQDEQGITRTQLVQDAHVRAQALGEAGNAVFFHARGFGRTAQARETLLKFGLSPSGQGQHCGCRQHENGSAELNLRQEELAQE
jgi:acyl-coenzyme A thioesterase PaaI-like protein